MRFRLRRHPSKRRLEEWLAETAPNLDAHIESCDRCANRVEDLDRPAFELRSALVEVLSLPANLQPRLAEGIDRRMRTRAELKLLAEMLGLPMSVVKTLGAGEDEE